MRYAFREAAAAFRRTPLLVLLSVVAIAFGFFVVGLFALTAYNVHRVLERVEEKVEIVAYLHDRADERQARALEANVQALPEVLGVRYISRAEALATAMQELDEFRGIYANLESNPLPASLEIRLQPGHRTPEAVARVAERLTTEPAVEDVRYGRDWVERIVFLRRVAGGVAAVIGGAFALVAAIIIATAVRIAVFARREEISIMRLVGASNAFVQGPVLLEGLLTGLLGGALAIGLTWAAFYFADRTLIRLEWMPPLWALVAVAGGALFGLVASGVSVRRHLRAV
jgi:cell division transport system permease protein